MVMVADLARRFRRRGMTDSKLSDRAFDVKRDARHFREQIDIDASDCAATESHFGCHHVERLR